MTTTAEKNKDYLRVEKALQFVAANFRKQPSLADIAASVHLSEYHFQRLFNRWAGVSPKQFMQYVTLQYARECLQAGNSVLETAYESGLSSPSRLGELFVRLEAITPGECRRGGEGLIVEYGFHHTVFGECLIATTVRGITGLHFCEAGRRDAALQDMKARLPAASYRLSQQTTAGIVEQIFSQDIPAGARACLSVLVSGTAFQIKVWEALLKIPPAGKVSYRQLALQTGGPGAVRAVGTAVGRNPVAVLIPCHRVIRSDGLPGGYHWGLGRKLALQGRESICAQDNGNGNSKGNSSAAG